MTDLSNLRELAEKATPGNWGRAASRTIDSEQDGSWQIVIDQMNDGVGAGVIEPGDAEYIVAAQPSTVLALLDRLEAAEREVERLRDRQESDDLANEAIRQKRRANESEVRAEAAEAKIAAVEALHFQYRGPGDRDICPVDEDFWPCPTARALQESEGE